MALESPRTQAVWRLDLSKAIGIESAHGKEYDSPTYRSLGLRWMMEYYPNFQNSGQTAFVIRITIPESVNKIKFKRWVVVDELNLSYELKDDITKETNGARSTTTTNRISSENVKDLTILTIRMQLEIVDVFDKKDKDITEQYIRSLNSNANDEAKEAVANNAAGDVTSEIVESLSSQMEKLTKDVQDIQKTIKDMQLRMNEEQKTDDLHDQIDQMKKQITTLLSGNGGGNNGMDKDEQEFKDWIEKKIKLEQYYDVFVENGITTLHVVALLEEKDLVDMGITKIGHKKQILSEIKLLQQKSDDQPAEGGTAYI